MFDVGVCCASQGTAFPPGRALLDIMIQTLKQDICQVGGPSLLLSEISDISTRIATHIPLHVQYACCHWAYHILNGDPTTMIELLEEFLSQHLLHWIEVCSLLGNLRNALVGVTNMHQLLMVCEDLFLT
jgi:hypothetical protein